MVDTEGAVAALDGALRQLRQRIGQLPRAAPQDAARRHLRLDKVGGAAGGNRREGA